MKRRIAYLIHEPKARIEITLRARGPEVQQYDIAPFPQVIKPLEMEFVDSAGGKTVA